MEHRKMTVSNCNDWATHSPGPWEHLDGKVYGGGVSGRLVATLDPAMIEEEVAMKEADARLIAAAPCLLAACRLALECLDGEPVPSDHLFTDLTNAIAKAEGGEA